MFFICLLPGNEFVYEQNPLGRKKITAEVCIHHLWFTNEDYATKESYMEPNRKTANDRKVLWEALLDGRIDVIATDHAPHTLDEKSNLI
jgi:dihydroorotase